VKLLTMAPAREHLAGCRTAREKISAAWYPDGDWPAHSLMVVDSLAAPAPPFVGPVATGVSWPDS
jgi:hypothetical protein